MVVGVQKVPHPTSEIPAFSVAQTGMVKGKWGVKVWVWYGKGPSGWLMDHEALSLPIHTGGDKLAFLEKELYLRKMGNKNCQ